MSSLWNNRLSISLFGESHSAAIGVVLDGLPAGMAVDFQQVQQMMLRRQAKSDGTTTSRVEPDVPEVLSGYYNGVTTGTPLGMVIRNTNTRSGDYNNLKDLMRPGHADYTGHVRYQGANDIRGGGHFSGRLTAPLVAAGAVCGQILEQKGVVCGAHLVKVKDIVCHGLDPVKVTKEELKELRTLPFPVREEAFRMQIIDTIQSARMKMDSVGGVVECAAVGMPVGIGDPMFGCLESRLSSLLFGIPGVKGVEFGNGFGCTNLMGSENNDPMYYDGDVVKTKTNRHGGILGGISSGMPILFRVAFKPTSSISLEQDTVNITTHQNDKLVIHGRHDPCIAVRAVPVVEAAANIVLLDSLL